MASPVYEAPASRSEDANPVEQDGDFDEANRDGIELFDNEDVLFSRVSGQTQLIIQVISPAALQQETTYFKEPDEVSQTDIVLMDEEAGTLADLQCEAEADDDDGLRKHMRTRSFTTRRSILSERT